MTPDYERGFNDALEMMASDEVWREATNAAWNQADINGYFILAGRIKSSNARAVVLASLKAAQQKIKEISSQKTNQD